MIRATGGLKPGGNIKRERPCDAEALFQVAKLDDQTADDDEQESEPGGNGDGFLEEVAAAQDADDGEEGDVNAEEFGEVPRFWSIDDEAVGAEDDKAGDDEKQSSATQSAANGGIATDLEQRGHEKYEPGKECHKWGEVDRRGITEPCGEGDVNSSATGSGRREWAIWPGMNGTDGTNRTNGTI